MISDVDMHGLAPRHCKECPLCKKAFSPLQHHYLLTYCQHTGNTLSTDPDVAIQKPPECPFYAYD